MAITTTFACDCCGRTETVKGTTQPGGWARVDAAQGWEAPPSRFTPGAPPIRMQESAAVVVCAPCLPACGARLAEILNERITAARVEWMEGSPGASSDVPLA